MIGQSILFPSPIPVLFRFTGQRFIPDAGKALKPAMMEPDVGGQAVKAQQDRYIGGTVRLGFPGKNRLFLKHGVQVQVRKTGGSCFFPKRVQGPCGRFHSPQTLDQRIEFVDREIRGAIDGPIGGMGKVLPYHIVRQRIECFRSSGSREQHRRGFAQRSRMNMDPIVVGPHEGKF